MSGNESAVPSPKNTKALKYNRLLPTGFGDRISVYLSVSAAAATVGADVYVSPSTYAVRITLSLPMSHSAFKDRQTAFKASLAKLLVLRARSWY